MSVAPALALGSGGMRGVAHLGVLLEFEQAGVEFSGIAGTSSGALMGSLWCVHGGDGAIEVVKRFVGSKWVTRMPNLIDGENRNGVRGFIGRLVRNVTLVRLLLSRSQLTTERFLEQVEFFLPDIDISALAVPFVAVATETYTGAEARLDDGALRLAVAASSAMPGVVPPIVVDGRRLQDGGAVAEIPVLAAKAWGGPVIAVEVSEALPKADADGDAFPRALLRAAAMGWQELRRRILADADVVIAPRINHLHWADFHAVDEAVAAGRVAAREFLGSASGRRLLS